MPYFRAVGPIASARVSIEALHISGFRPQNKAWDGKICPYRPLNLFF